MFAVLVSAAVLVQAQALPAPPASPHLTAARIAGGALLERGSARFARHLADHVGARLAGSKQAEQAVVWAEAAMKRAGLQRVRREPVTVRAWERGPITAILRADPDTAGSVDQKLAVLALGGSVATAAGGVEADVVEVTSLEQLKALGERARGQIIFFNRPVAQSRDGSTYGEVSGLRYKAPPEAARLGAVAFLFRSAGTGYHRLPHTGITQLGNAANPSVPAAALALEDAERLSRRLSGGKARVFLRLEAKELPPAPSFNVVGELPGSTRKDEIVLLGAHLDSWDVGQGALDDGAGVGIALDTARLLAGTRPARTLRLVMFMSEEVDGAGAKGYAAAHKAELSRHVAALEADAGDGAPYGYGVTSGEAGVALVKKWVAPLSALVPVDVRVVKAGGADTRPLQAAGVPVLEVAQDMSKYFDWHHTEGDTSDKIDDATIALATAAFANLTWSLLSAPELLPRTAPAP
jgi:Iap family predicted aminopeptidase